LTAKTPFDPVLERTWNLVPSANRTISIMAAMESMGRLIPSLVAQATLGDIRHQPTTFGDFQIDLIP
jgi:hypothetical protein